MYVYVCVYRYVYTFVCICMGERVLRACVADIPETSRASESQHSQLLLRLSFPQALRTDILRLLRANLGLLGYFEPRILGSHVL